MAILHKNFKIFCITILTIMLCGCSVGPDYKKPCTAMPKKYKEAPEGWKYAEPRDTASKGQWWLVFKDPQLNLLEDKLNKDNLTIAQVVAQLKESIAILDETKAAFWPVVSVTFNATRTGPAANATTSSNGSQSPYSAFLLEPTATWSPDVFGAVRRAVEASRAGAQATVADLANTRLSMQALLAQTYFQLKTLDIVQILLDNTVVAYGKSLELTENQYAAGIVSRLDIAQAQTQLKTTEAEALDNKILRAQYEHAIAVLIGEQPENFSIAKDEIAFVTPIIPLGLPSNLLERRPDIAQAERLMAQANAQIGVEIAAFFPTFPLTAMDGYNSNVFKNLISSPSNVWSLGASVVETIFEGGLRTAQVAAARATYAQNVAAYKQTILAALQNVEDNIIAFNTLNREIVIQNEAVASAQKALDITLNQYKAGIVTYLEVVIAQTTAYNTKRTVDALISRRMVAAVGLIQSLGGGWENDGLPLTPQTKEPCPMKEECATRIATSCMQYTK